MNKKLIAITLSTLVLVGGITGCSNKVLAQVVTVLKLNNLLISH